VLAVALDIPLPLPGIDAVVSPAVFTGRFVKFDFHAGHVQILPKTAANTPTGAANDYLGADSHGHINRVPSVQVTLPGRAPFIAMADTGAQRGIALPLTMAQGLALAGPLQPADPVRMVGVTLNASHAQLEGAIRIGPLTLQNPDITFVDGAEFANIGFPVLRNAVIVLDPEVHRSWVLPPDA